MAEAIITTEDDSSVVSENSFVILGQGSFPMDLNDGGTETINSPTFSLTNEEPQENGSINGDLGDRHSPLPETSSVGIQIKLEKLVKENLLLKETLNQSNLAMKNQFDTLALWHEEVVKTHESHKQKFLETQDQIFKLRNENMNLKMLIQQNLEKCCGNDSTLLNLDPEGISSPLDTAADKDLEENFLKTHTRELKLKNTELEKRLHAIVQEKSDLEKKLQDAIEENSDLKKEIEGLKTEIRAEHQDSQSLKSKKETQEHFLKVYLWKLKLNYSEVEKRLCDVMQEKSDLEKKYQDAIEENADLKKEIEGLKTDACAEHQDPKSLASNKASDEPEDNEKSGEIISLDPEISVINKLSKSVEAELVMTASKRDFMELKKQFEEQSEISLKNSEKLEKMMVLYEGIVEEKDKLKYQLEQSKAVTQELTDKIADLNAELEAKDEQLKHKVDEFEMIKKEMQKLVLDCEEVAILRAQVELYQNDFNEERKAREQAISEKEKMAEQVRFLERTLSDFKKRDKENEKKGSASAPKEQKPTLSYMCPKCMKRLPTLTECESHVDACLDSDMFP